jgi:hypothetical protein
MDFKAIEFEEIAGGKIVEIGVTGKLTGEDYETFVPELDRLIQKHGKIRVLLELNDFQGWDLSALWQDTKFAFKHFDDIERVAIVGQRIWHEGIAEFCKPFTTAAIRYFDVNESDDAQRWITEPFQGERISV